MARELEQIQHLAEEQGFSHLKQVNELLLFTCQGLIPMSAVKCCLKDATETEVELS